MVITDVEACTLGVIWQRGPCTAYVVRKELAASSTPFWSASAGAIYPALARLRSRRLVRAEPRAWGPRKRAYLTITPRGLAVLRAWLSPSPAIAGAAYDPLRTRACFLAALPAAARRRFVRDAIADTADALAVLAGQLDDPHPGGVFERLATRGSMLSLEARLAWLAEVERVVR